MHASLRCCAPLFPTESEQTWFVPSDLLALRPAITIPMLRLARGAPSFPHSLLCTPARPRSSCPHPSSLHSNTTAVLPCLRRRFIALPKLPDLPNLLRPVSSRQYKDSIVVKYSQQEFYDLVANVDQYHLFLPWCTYSKMSTTTPSSPPAGSDRGVQVGPGPVTVRHGELGIGFNSFQERYVSTVTCQEPWTVRAVSYDSKLFKELSTTWRFTPDIPKSTTLEATMDQELQERQLLTRRESKGSGVESRHPTPPTPESLSLQPQPPEQPEHFFTAATVFGEAAVPNLKRRKDPPQPTSTSTFDSMSPSPSPLPSEPAQVRQPNNPPVSQSSPSPLESHHALDPSDMQQFPSPPKQTIHRTASPSNLATMKPSDYPSCLVDFEIQFEFASAVHASMSSLFFDQVSKEMLKAFVHRAEILYGKR